MRKDPIQAAAAFVEQFFPDCEAALLGGSTARGEATSTSDLDIFIYDSSIHKEHRESFYEQEWMIEAFVHNNESYKRYCTQDCERGRPSLPRMVFEGIVIRNSPSVPGLKAHAEKLLSSGPPPWNSKDIELKRYFITDLVLDFIGSSDRHEEIFIAGTLAELVHEFVLRTDAQWTGTSKWIWKVMKAYDPMLAA